jgi:hypothetical protein
MLNEETEKFRLFKLKLSYAIARGNNKITYHRTHGYFVDGISLNLIRGLANSSTVFTVQTFMQWLNRMRIKKGARWVPISKSVARYSFDYWSGPVPFCISWPPNENLVIIGEEPDEGLDESIRALANEINHDLKKPDPNNLVFIALPPVDLPSMSGYRPTSSVCNLTSQSSHRSANVFLPPTFQLGENHVYSQAAMTPIGFRPAVAQFSNMVSSVPSKSLKRLALGHSRPARKNPRIEANPFSAATYLPLTTTQTFQEFPNNNCQVVNFYPKDLSLQQVDNDLTMVSNQNHVSMLASYDNSNSTPIIQDSFIAASSYQLDPELSGHDTFQKFPQQTLQYTDQNNFQNTVHPSSFSNYYPPISLDTPSRTLSHFSSCQETPVSISYLPSCDSMAWDCYEKFPIDFDLTAGEQSGLNTDKLATEILNSKDFLTQSRSLSEYSVHQRNFVNTSWTTPEYSQLLDLPDQAHTHCDTITPLPTRQQQQQTQQFSLWLPTAHTSESTLDQITHATSRNNQFPNIITNPRLRTSSRQSISTTSSSSLLQGSPRAISAQSSSEQIYAFLTEGLSGFGSRPSTEAGGQLQVSPAVAQLASGSPEDPQFTKSGCSAARPAITSHDGEPQFEYYNTEDTGVVFAPQALPPRVGSPSYKVPRGLDAQKPGLATHNLPYPADGGKDESKLAAAGYPHPNNGNIGRHTGA